MNFNDFGDGPLDGSGFDAFETASQDVFGDTQGGSQLNNPLGLSDKDMQLQYDNFSEVPKSSTEDDEDEDGGQTSKLNTNKEADDEEEDSEKRDPQSSSKSGTLNASAIFGSDSEDEGPQDADVEGADPPEGAEYPSTGGAEADSDGAASIKSDLEPAESQQSDFDVMMAQKKEERRRSFKRRKGQDVDLINDFDDRIQEIISEMKKAAEEDRKANQRNECAFNKLKMLPSVVHCLQKQDLQTAFLDCGILSALADWLAPLPDGNLTHLKIRESILKLLGEMSSIEPAQLKNSGVGKAVMLLYKHPKEMKENRAKAGKLIQEWSRPIFGTSANYKSMTREEREERDMELMQQRQTPNKKRRVGGAGDEGGEGVEGAEGEDPNKEIPRARVPQPSLKDYVIRPKSQMSVMDAEGGGSARRSGGQKPKNRFEKRIRGMKEQARSAKSLGNHVSLAGAKM